MTEIRLTKGEIDHLIIALEAIRKSGDGTFDGKTNRLIRVLNSFRSQLVI